MIVAVRIVVLLGSVGVVALAASRKIGSGAVTPGECESCGGLVSPHAPYCKHCGSPL